MWLTGLLSSNTWCCCASVRHLEGDSGGIHITAAVGNTWMEDSMDLSSSAAAEQPTVRLLDEELWEQFARVGTEMVINKPGRRFFPLPHVQLSGLEPETLYSVALRVEELSNDRYTYSQKTGWVLNSVADRDNSFVDRANKLWANTESSSCKFYPRSPTLGGTWQDGALLFNKLKLTNDVFKANDPCKIVVRSMHKYVIVIDVFKHEQTGLGAPTSFHLPHTEFIAVTAYQNPRLTQLKIDNNPFAKAFRTKSWHANRKRSAENHDDNSKLSDENWSSGASQASSRSRLQQTSLADAQQTSLADAQHWLQARSRFPWYPQGFWMAPSHYRLHHPAWISPFHFIPPPPEPMEPYDFSIAKFKSIK